MKLRVEADCSSVRTCRLPALPGARRAVGTAAPMKHQSSRALPPELPEHVWKISPSITSCAGQDLHSRSPNASNGSCVGHLIDPIRSEERRVGKECRYRW